MKFECFSHWSELPLEVDALFKYCSRHSMFFTREWFETLYDATLEDNQSLLLVCVLRNESVVALLPLIKTEKYIESLSHRYTALYSVLLAEDEQDEIIECLAEGLSNKPINSLALSPVAEDDKQLTKLYNALKARGYEYHQKFFFYNWIHKVQQQPFSEYMAARPSQLKNTIKRKKKKLEKEHEYDMRLYKGSEVKQGLIDYHSSYSASWKANEQYLDLLNAIAINFSTDNYTRVAVLTIDGEAAAAQLWFVVAGKANIFRLAYDEKWKKYSPGSILTAYIMEYVIDIDKVVEIDFLTGNEQYKQDWMTERRQRFRVSFIKQKNTQNRAEKLIGLFKKLFKESD